MLRLKRITCIVLGVVLVMTLGAGENSPAWAKKKKKSKATVFLTQKKALNFIFPDVKEITEELHAPSPEEYKELAARVKNEYKAKMDKRYDKEFTFYIGMTAEGTVSHYAMIDKVPGKWGPITYIIGIDPEGSIIDMAVLKLSEKRGRPVQKRRFLKQFMGKSLGDRLKIKKDLRGVSGATISSKGMSNGARKVLALFDIFYGKAKSTESSPSEE